MEPARINSLTFEVYSMLYKGHCQITGVGSFFPEQAVSSIDLMNELKTEVRFGIPHDWMDTKIGVKARRYASDQTKPSELSLIAAIQAIDDAGVTPADIDAVIYCGIVGDQIEPSTAHNIQAEVGAVNAECLDVHNACHGFCNGISIANMMIAAGAEHVLVVTAELTRGARQVFPALEKAKDVDEFHSKIGILTVGDGAGAMIISRKQVDYEGIQQINCKSWGEHAELCSYDLDLGHFKGGMNMEKISALMLRFNGNLLKTTLRILDWNKESIDHLIMHQVGQRPFDGMLKLTGVAREKAPKTLDNYGNITTATIPANYHMLKQSGRLSSGDRCLIIGGGSGVVVSHMGIII